MYSYILDWLGVSSLSLNDNIVFAGIVAISIIFLQFLFDIIRFIMYYITRR